MTVIKKIILWIVSIIILLTLFSGIFYVIQFFSNHTPDPTVNIYGVKGFGGANTALSRTWKAKNLKVEKDENGIVSDFDNVYPYSEMKPVTDEKGNVFITIPSFYYGVHDNGSDTYEILISRNKVKNLCENFSPLMYVGAYFISLDDEGNAKSVPTNTFDNTKSLTEYRNLCENVGSGYQQFDYKMLNAINILFTVEFATTDSQSVFESASFNKDNDFTKNAYNGIIPLNTYSEDNKYSSLFGQNGCFKYRGIENYFGCYMTYVDGIYAFSTTASYMIYNPENYKNMDRVCGRLDWCYEILDGFLPVEGYACNVDVIKGTVIVSSDGTSRPTPSSYFCDYTYPGNSTNSAFYFGGCYGFERRAGIWANYKNTGINQSQRFISARLCYRPNGITE